MCVCVRFKKTYYARRRILVGVRFVSGRIGAVGRISCRRSSFVLGNYGSRSFTITRTRRGSPRRARRLVRKLANLTSTLAHDAHAIRRRREAATAERARRASFREDADREAIGEPPFSPVRPSQARRPPAFGRAPPKRSARPNRRRRRTAASRAVVSFEHDPQPDVVPEQYPRTAMCVRNVDVHVSCSSHVDAQLAAFFIDPRAK